MAKRQATLGGGRPSKGAREFMATRLPLGSSEIVKQLAEERDWSYSETLAALVDIALAHRAELPPARVEQEELPLTKAS